MIPHDIHPDSPAGSGGPGGFKSPKPLGGNPEFDKWGSPHPLGTQQLLASVKAVVAQAHSTSKATSTLERRVRGAIALGWLPGFSSAAAQFGFDKELLMAVAYRESRLDPKYLRVAGDKGHGYGLLQVDNRAFPDWVKSGKWHNAADCIEMGASILAGKRTEIQEGVGKELEVFSRKSSKSYQFTGGEISGADLIRVAVADYNAGLWGYYAYSTGDDVDAYTTGGDYSRDVLAKAEKIRIIVGGSTSSSPGGFYDAIAEFA